MSEQPKNEAECSLCGDMDGALFLRARCHPSAPLRAIKEDDVLILRCYLPDCDREVVRLELAGPPLTEAMTALAESVKLQAHYATLLNMHDGGKRLIFPTVESWLDRLRQTGTLEARSRERGHDA
jgi:hypothetical protein